MRERQISNLSQLVEFAECNGFFDGTWIFRGQSQRFNNVLQPKIGRDDARKTDKGENCGRRDYSKRDEITIFNRFRKQALPFLSFRPESILDWLAVAQHHGMPTRLLDWTESLLVAAFFAAEHMGAKGTAVIYAIKKPPIVPERSQDQPFGLAGVWLYRPAHFTPRIPAQQSVFTIHSDPTASHPLGDDAWCISFPGCHCGELKDRLNSCAINRETLFPGLDGLAATLAWRYKWRQVAPS